MRQRLLPIGYASLALGLLFNCLFYNHNVGVNFFIYTAALLLVTAGLMAYWRRRISASFISLAVLAGLFALLVSVRANGFVQFLDIVTALYLLSLTGLIVWRPNHSLLDFTSVDYLRRAANLPILATAECLRLLRRAAGFNFQSNQAAKRRTMPVVRGILISLPILVIFLLLFASADLVFKQYVHSLFDWHLSPELVSRTILILVVSSFFAGLYALLFTRSSDDEPAGGKAKLWRLGAIEATVVLGSVASLFLLFVIIQLHYLFGGSSNVVIAGGYTYAEYARKGFFELILVAVIVFLLLLALNAATVRRTIQQHFVFIGLCSLLVVEVGLIMLSAHHRLSLYEQAYGFTLLRLYSHLFIGWLFVATVLLLVYIIGKYPEKLFARWLFASIVIFLGVINVINPDALVAQQNIQRFRISGELDVPYLGSLSDDATPAIATLLDDKDPQLRQAAAHELYLNGLFARDADQSWQAANLSHHRAELIRHDHQAQLNAAKDYVPPQPTL